MLPQQYCLRWKYHHSNLQTMFSQLLDRGSFCDVTLACEGQLIRAHRVVLCACSTFFDTVLSNYASERDPIIIMKDVTFADVRCLIEFMYKGEINVEHAHLASLLKTADDLKIKGLAEVTWRDDDEGPTPPTPATEFHSPSREPIHAHDYQQQRSSSPFDGRRHDRRRSVTPPPLDARKLHSLPTLTPIPTSRTTALAATASSIEYLGPKRKRGRPPLDDAYDVFNIHKLAHYANQMEQQTYLEAQNYAEESRQHVGAGPAMSPTSAAVAYQHHVQQQQNKQRMRQRQKRSSSSDVEHEELQNPGPEWINSNLEVNISEPTQEPRNNSPIESVETKPGKEEEIETGESSKKTEGKRRENAEKTSEDSKHSIDRASKRKKSQTEQQPHVATPPQAQHSAEIIDKSDKEQTEEESQDAATVPRPVEEIENVKQVMEQQRLPMPETSATTSSSRQSSPISMHRSNGVTASSSSSSSTSTPLTSTSSSSSSSSLPPPPPPPPSATLQHPNFGKFAPEGYLLNEHGMLMTHDSFVHAPIASIPVTQGSSASANGSDQEFVDIKMEDFDAADLRLTSEEMSQWQDVIKMDDYLAKGRRPQFWEEPFTRRVLDAIKNKRLEMKKAARILGVSYGTLYGRYREVYGCLKHPYSNSSGYRPSSSQLALQPRFDMVWPNAKRDGTALLPGPLDIGKLRPKDLSELWARPQI